MKTLICTVGLPQTGKSSWSSQMISKGWIVINPDSIRLALHGKPYDLAFETLVWTITRTSINALFLIGHDQIILDSTLVSHKSRKPWTQLVGVQTYFKVFNTEKEVCIQRALINNRLDLIDIIERMSQKFQPLFCEEMAYLE
jgi:predicted kinase